MTVRTTARAAYDNGDFETAIGLIETALAAEDDPLLRCDLARYLYLEGRSREAEEQLRLAAPSAGTGEARATWLSTQAWLRLNSLDLPATLEAAHEALALARSLGLARVAAESLGQIATSEVVTVGVEEGLARAEEALAMARGVPDPDLVAEITVNVATALEMAGDEAGSLAYLERGQRELVGVRDVLVADFLRLFLAQLLARTDRVAEGKDLLETVKPAWMDGIVGVFYRIVQAEVAVAAGDLSGAMLWIDGIDVSGWAYTDQWNSQLDALLDVVGRGFDQGASLP